ncbi:ubiquitin-like-conjugating enzyme ATG10 isoform X2 [Clinocottus analis]|uniref:ubiquitin-like-conjugating enzyme ATG10 isoform X2 n=1 Tax=Clinocottus analis TaxID=304258 RepID=UPI0035C1B58A
MSCCPLKEDDFRRCCLLFVQWSDHLRDGWSWEVVQGSEEGYLRKIALRLAIIAPSPARDQTGSGSDSEAHTSCTEPRGREEEQSGLGASVNTDSACGDIADDEEEVDEGDGVCAVSGCSSQVLQYEYHILHSCSYATPVLYFRAFTQEGRSLSLEEVWSSVHPNFRLRLQSSPLDTITLQEHPLLGQPFFMLHPCRTEEFMRPVLQVAQEQHRPVNYVLSWLSVVGPVVGLDVPLKYSSQLCSAASPGSGTEPD